MDKALKELLKSGYEFQEPSIYLGNALFDHETQQDLKINIPLKTLNRHGLIAGATGTGKTKTIQMLSEQLSKAGISVLLMDMKGDLSGLAMKGQVSQGVEQRVKFLGAPFAPQSFPVEFLAIGNQQGVPLRASLIEFGPLLFAQILGLNKTQTSLLSILFKYAEDKEYLLIDLSDFKTLLQHAQGPEKNEIEASYGAISSTSLKTILRSVIELESQGGEALFGEPSFDVQDLLAQENGLGVISIIRLMSLQDQPKLFSSFMLGLLSSIFKNYPELGDTDKPKLVIFLDEAHLIFKYGSDELISKLDSIIRLIRSKGVGLIFCTQSPKDIPEDILSQLGLKVQHALRAFTAKDRKAIKLAAENFPPSDYYDIPALLTSIGVGEALVTSLNPKGKPTPLALTLLRPPESRMGTLEEAEFLNYLGSSKLIHKYNQPNQRVSTTNHIESYEDETPQTQQAPSKAEKPEPSTIETLSKNTLFRQVIRTIFRELTRGILSALGIKKTRGRKK